MQQHTKHRAVGKFTSAARFLWVRFWVAGLSVEEGTLPIITVTPVPSRWSKSHYHSRGASPQLIHLREGRAGSHVLRAGTLAFAEHTHSTCVQRACPHLQGEACPRLAVRV